MGLLGDLPQDMVLDARWSYVAPGVSRHNPEVDATEANYLTVYARVGAEEIGKLELSGDIEHWTISELRTEVQFQRRGVASAMLSRAHTQLGQLREDYELHHNTLLENDGLAWAMAVDGGEGTRSWEYENEERIRERFDDGILAAEHDRHLQCLLASDDPAERERARALAAEAGRLPQVELDADRVYVPEAMIAQLHRPSPAPLRLVRKSLGGHEEESSSYWVAVTGLDKLREATQGGYVTGHVTDVQDQSLGEQPDIRNLVELSQALERPPLLSQIDTAGEAISAAEVSGRPTLDH
jgi:hypothetical protein